MPTRQCCANISAGIFAAAPDTCRSWPPRSMRRNACGRLLVLDLGNSFLASVERDPDALAIVDGATRLTYAQWYRHISALVAAFDELGLLPGDHLVTALQNRLEAATLHWACQFAGIVITPINWRSKSDEVDFYIENAEAKAIVFEEVSGEAVRLSAAAK